MDMLPLLPLASAAGPAAGEGMMQLMQRFVLQVAVILLAARALGLLFRRVLRLPQVLGELCAGMLIGPHALGAVAIGPLPPLFPAAAAAGSSVIPVSPELYGVATIASILLLFLSGLETNLRLFLRYSGVGTAVGIGGAVLSFAAGDFCAVLFGLAPNAMHPDALFLGTIATATSVGITARILSERRRTDSPEGVTVLAAAVLDDVVGIIVLAAVFALGRAQASGVAVEWTHVGIVLLRTLAWWVVFMVAGLAASPWLGRGLRRLRSGEVMASFAMGLAMLMAGAIESVGLAMIIGAYIMGLSLSHTDLVHVIEENLRGAYNLFVPVFFCVMGMLIDFGAMRGVVAAGLVFSLLAVCAKVLGCGGPALLMQFNLRGALRIGAGMVPRGEVALIVAGVGLSSGAIDTRIFGIAVMMTVLTTLVAPPLLLRSLAGGSGLKAGEEREQGQRITVPFPSPEVAEVFLARSGRAFRQEGFFVNMIDRDPPTYQVRRDRMAFTLRQEEKEVVLTSSGPHMDVARLILVEELVDLKSIADSFRTVQALSIESDLASGLFR